jgi:hypothetical protein
MTAISPELSVIVTVVSDTTAQSDTRHLEACLQALQRQLGAPQLETIVTCDSRLPGIEQVAQRFPEVRFVCLPYARSARSGASREHHDQLRWAGLREAKGRLIAVLEDHGRPDPHWCAALVKEHAGSHAAVGGAIENGVDRPLNWAVYFADFGRYQNPVPRGPSARLSDANVSYKRAALEAVPSAWATTYNEVVVHQALLAHGQTLWLSPDVVVYQHRMNLALGSQLLERYVWGRSYAATRVANAPAWKRLTLAVLSPLLPPLLLVRGLGNVLRTRRNRTAFIKALPYFVLLCFAWASGEFAGYSTGRAGASSEVSPQPAQPASA